MKIMSVERSELVLGEVNVDCDVVSDAAVCSKRSSVVDDLEKQLLNVELQQKIFVRGLVKQLNEIKLAHSKLGDSGSGLHEKLHKQQLVLQTSHRHVTTAEQSTETDEDQLDGKMAITTGLFEENRKLTERLAQLEMNEIRLKREIKRSEEKHSLKLRRQIEMTNATKLRHLGTLVMQSDETKQIVTELQQEVRRYDSKPPTCNIGEFIHTEN
jgi:hypothetical protein